MSVLTGTCMLDEAHTENTFFLTVLSCAIEVMSFLILVSGFV